MASTIESMHGILHEVSAKLSSLNSAQGVPRSASSVRKRARHDNSLVEDIRPEITALQHSKSVKNDLHHQVTLKLRVQI